MTQELTLRARRAQWPGVEVPSYESWFKGCAIKHPSKINFPRKVTFEFEEGMNLAVMNLMYGWMGTFRNFKSGLGAGEDGFKTDGIVRLMNYDDEVLAKATLYNLYIESMPEIALDPAQDASIMIPVTFSYDFWLFS
jgi:hypothetical protein